jgi:poly(hydroxyalkanoate) granule-associated protein
MAGKKKIEKEGSSWIGEVEKYSRQIWLAGLGAYSKISNDGSKLFENLVKDGEKAEKQTKSDVDKQVDAAKAKAQSAKSRVGDVKDLALGKWSELEGAFDKRLNSAISRLGVPSRNEVKALHSKVDLLTKQIEKLTGASVTPVSAKAAAKPAVKAPAKTSAAKPAAKAAAKPVAAKSAAAKPVAAKAPAKPAVKPAAAKPAAAPKKPATPKAAAPKPATPAATATPSATAAPAATPAPATTPASTPVSQS